MNLLQQKDNKKNRCSKLKQGAVSCSLKSRIFVQYIKGQPQVNGHAVGRFLTCLTKSQIWKKIYLFKQIL